MKKEQVYINLFFLLHINSNKVSIIHMFLPIFEQTVEQLSDQNL